VHSFLADSTVGNTLELYDFAPVFLIGSKSQPAPCHSIKIEQGFKIFGERIEGVLGVAVKP